tara:strand:- start:182 stop:850 length:669 start_codon:yes stop_codon:yes gene_type:complete
MLKLNLIIPVFCACFIFMAFSPKAFAIDCGYMAPKVIINTLRKPTEYVRNFSSAGLTQLHTGAFRPGRPNVLGLGGGPMSVDLNISFETKSEGSVSCLRIQSIVADFIIYPSVMIARNYASGSCEFEAVLVHEQQHIDTFVRFQNEYAPKLKTQIQRAARDFGRPKAMASVNRDFMQRDMQKSISSAVNDYMGHMQSVVRKRQLKVDSAEEYAHVAAQCTNW